MDLGTIMTFIETVGFPAAIAIVLLIMVKKWVGDMSLKVASLSKDFSDFKDIVSKGFTELREGDKENITVFKDDTVKGFEKVREAQVNFMTEWRTTVKGYGEVNRNTAEFITYAYKTLQKLEGEVIALRQWIQRLEMTIAIRDSQVVKKDGTKKEETNVQT